MPTIAIVAGDGVGPEVMDEGLKVLRRDKADLEKTAAGFAAATARAEDSIAGLKNTTDGLQESLELAAQIPRSLLKIPVT